MKKLLVIGVIFLFMVMTVSSSTQASKVNDDVEIKISAGRFGLNIGTHLRVDIINNDDENITVFYSLSSNYLFTNLRDETINYNSTYEGIGNYSSFYFKYFLGFGIDLFSITAECEDTSVTRNGIWIGIRLCILF